MKILLMNKLSVITRLSTALLMNTSVLMKRREFLSVIDILLLCFLLSLNTLQSVEAEDAKYLTLVSLTFDDGLRESAAIQPLLDSGLKATFYVNSNRIRTSGPIDNTGFLTKAELDTLFNNGYEIGGHTIDHVDLATLSDAAQLQAICDDLATLRGWYGDNVYSFAYPYSSTGPTSQSIVAGGCPGTYGPLNKPVGKYENARAVGNVGCQDCSLSESIPSANPYYIATTDSVLSTTTLAEMQNYVTQAETTGGWVTLVFHSVCNGCDTFAVTQEMLDNFLTWLKARESQGTYVRTVHQVMSGDYPPPPPPPPLGPNLLINPSLELLGVNNLPDCWQLGDWGSSTATWTRTTDAYSGGFAQRLQITSYSDGDRKLLPTFDAGQMSGGCAPSVNAGVNYQISAYYKSTTFSTVILFYLDANGVWQYWRNGPNLPASNDWAKMTYYTGPLPTGVQAISFGIALANVGTLTTDEYSMAKVLDGPPPPPNTAPTFVGGASTLQVNTNASALDLKANLHISDTDIGQTETWSQSVGPAHGTLVISGATAGSGSINIAPGGTLTYQPEAGYSGSDSFTVQVSDGTATATRTFAVTVTALPNTAPTFVGGTTTLQVNMNSSALDLKANLHVSDTDTGQTEIWSQSVGPTHGALVISGATAGSGGTNITPAGTITYQPAAGYSGSDSFAVQVGDGAATAIRTFSITVSAAQTLGPNLLINSSLEIDQDANNQPDCWQRGGWGNNTAAWTRTTDAYTGGFAQQLQITAYNSGDRKLLPTLDTGQMSGGCAPSVEVGASYQISAYYKSTTASTAVLFYLDANNVWQYWKSGPNLPASGAYTQMTYNTGPLPAGAKAMSFGIALTSVGTLTTDEYSLAKIPDGPPPPNTAPTFVGGTTTLQMNTNSSALDLKPNLHVSDTDTGQTETWSQSVGPIHGTLVVTGATAASGSANIAPGGTLTYQPEAGYSGSDSFTVQVGDGTATAARTFAVTVLPNTAPAFVGGTTTLQVNTNSSALDLKANLHVSDTDTGQTETWSQSVAPLHGTLVVTGATASSGSANITPSGTITYQPAAGYSGSDSFTVQVGDGAATAIRTFSITVSAAQNLGPNLLINSSLEIDQDANNQPDCWQRGGWGTNTVAWTRTTDAYTGGFAQQLQITAYSSGDRKLLPTLDTDQMSGGCAASVEVGANYQISAYYKSTAASTAVLFYLDANNVWQYWKSGPNLPASGAYSQMTYNTGPLPAGAKAMSFGIALMRVGTLTTDEYSMAKVPDGSPP